MELLLDEDEISTQWVRPDPTGFTVRTQYKNTDRVLDGNACARNEAPKTFRSDGVDFHHVCRVPIELYDQLTIRFGRPPTAKELIQLAQDRDFSKLKTREVKL